MNEYEKPDKFCLADFCMKLKMHDEGKCICAPSDQQSPGPNVRSELYAVFDVYPLDWLCILFGSSSPFALRPDCRKLMDYPGHGSTYSTSEDRRKKGAVPFLLPTNDEPSGHLFLSVRSMKKILNP